MYNLMNMGEEAYNSCKYDAERDRRRNYPVLSLVTRRGAEDAISNLPADFETRFARSL